jgi:DNA-binding transcriptional ArsR family regulator
MSRPKTSRYSPHRVEPEILEAVFIARRPLLERLVRDFLESAKTGVGRYEAITGPRGIGKSHLLALVQHQIRTHPEQDTLELVFLGEEVYVASLIDMFGRVLSSLPAIPGMPLAADLLARLRKAPAVEQLDRVIQLLDSRTGSTPILLLIENLDRVFQAIGTQGQSRLRAFLQARPSWSVLASSCTWGEAFTSANRPFYNTFYPSLLKTFSCIECHDMLRRLAVVEQDNKLLSQLNGPTAEAQVGAIRHLLGGNPRAMAMIFPFLQGGRLDDLEGAFFELAEELTPYFQEQLAQRPSGQQPYLEHLASSWYPLTVSELSELTYSTPQTASGQLRYLKRDQLVLSTEVGREQFYEIAEPLHRLAWAMKRPDRAPLALARFVSVWLSQEEIRKRWRSSSLKERHLYQLAWQPPLDNDIPSWLEKRIQSILHATKALEAAEELYLAHPSPKTFLCLLSQIIQSAPERIRMMAQEGMERFEEQVAVALLDMHRSNGADLPNELLSRCRASLFKQNDSSLDTFLLIEHGAEAELLDEIASRLAEKFRAGEVPQQGLLEELWMNGDLFNILDIGQSIKISTLSWMDCLAYIDTLVEMGEQGEAERVAVEAAGSLDGSDAILIQGWTGYFLDKLSDAEQFMQQGLEQWPDDTRFWQLAIDVAWKRRDFLRVEHYLVQLVEKTPTAKDLEDLGLCRLYQRRFAAAIPPFEQAQQAGADVAITLGIVRFCEGTLSLEEASSLPPLFNALLQSLGEHPIPLPDPEFIDFRVLPFLLGTWIRRFIPYYFSSDNRSTRLKTLFSDPAPGWSRSLSSVMLIDIIHGLNTDFPSKLEPLVNDLAQALPLGTHEPMLRAALALPQTTALYAQLAQPERKQIYRMLKHSNKTDTLSRLPKEDFSN